MGPAWLDYRRGQVDSLAIGDIFISLSHRTGKDAKQDQELHPRSMGSKNVFEWR